MIKARQVLSNILNLKRLEPEQGKAENLQRVTRQREQEYRIGRSKKENKAKFIKYVTAELNNNLPVDFKYSDFVFLDDGGFSYVFKCRKTSKPSKEYCAKYVAPFKLNKKTLDKVQRHERLIKSLVKTEVDILSTFKSSISIKYKKYYKLANGAVLIILELAPHGNINRFFHKHEFFDENGCLAEHVISYLTYYLVKFLNESRKNEIIHNDIKPDNILVNKSLGFCFSDFGLSERIRPGEDNTYSLLDSGTTIFLAPEKIDCCKIGLEDFKDDCYKCDVWAAGVCLFYYGFGKMPFGMEKNDDKKTVKAKITSVKLEFCKETCRVKEQYEDFKTLLEGMLEPDLNKRFRVVEVSRNAFVTRSKEVQQGLRIAIKGKETVEAIRIMKEGIIKN